MPNSIKVRGHHEQPIEVDVKQKPTNISYSWEDHLTFEENRLKIPLPIGMNAGFQCITQPQPKVLKKEFPFDVGCDILSRIGNHFHSFFGTECKMAC